MRKSRKNNEENVIKKKSRKKLHNSSRIFENEMQNFRKLKKSEIIEILPTFEIIFGWK